MSRLSYADPTQLAELMLRSGLPENTPPSNAFRMLAHSPSVGSAVLRLILAIMTDTDLDPRLRELVVLRVAQRCNGRYVWVQHAVIAASVGIVDTRIAALERGETPRGLFDKRERAPLALADEVVDSCRAADDTLRALQELFSPREVLELLLLIGYVRMICVLMTTLDVETDPPFGMKILELVRDTAANLDDRV